MLTANDVYLNYKYSVSIDNKEEMFFMKVTLPELSAQVIPASRGDSASKIAEKILGKPEVSNLTLEEGVTKSNQIFDWAKENIMQSQRKKYGILVSLLDLDNNPVKKWTFTGGQIVKVTPGELDTKGNDIYITKAEFAVESWEVSG